MAEVRVLVEAEINPTENEEKVKTAIKNIFGDMPTEISPSKTRKVITAKGEGLSTLADFRELLRRDRVRAAARKVFFAGSGETCIIFFLNKQAAFANHVSFSQESGESPLGPIKATIKCGKPSELIDWLAPRTP
jgi:hypothetical protein